MHSAIIHVAENECQRRCGKEYRQSGLRNPGKRCRAKRLERSPRRTALTSPITPIGVNVAVLPARQTRRVNPERRFHRDHIRPRTRENNRRAFRVSPAVLASVVPRFGVAGRPRGMPLRVSKPRKDDLAVVLNWPKRHRSTLPPVTIIGAWTAMLPEIHNPRPRHAGIKATVPVSRTTSQDFHRDPNLRGQGRAAGGR